MTPITAPDVVVRTWRKAATMARHAAHRPDDPSVADALRFAPREVGELVVHMSEALSLASGIFAESVANATPGVPCPIPDPGGAAYRCECDQEGRAGCATILAELYTANSQVSHNTKHARMRPIDLPLVAGDDGCEGDVRHPDLNSDPR